LSESAGTHCTMHASVTLQNSGTLQADWTSN